MVSYSHGAVIEAFTSYSAFRNLLIKLNPDAFAEVLSEWLRANEGTLPRQLALDGKFIGKTVGLVSLSDASTGVPVAMGAASEKEGEGSKCEIRVGRRLIQSVKVYGRIEERQS